MKGNTETREVEVVLEEQRRDFPLVEKGTQRGACGEETTVTEWRECFCPEDGVNVPLSPLWQKSSNGLSPSLSLSLSPSHTHTHTHSPTFQTEHGSSFNFTYVRGESSDGRSRFPSLCPFFLPLSLFFFPLPSLSRSPSLCTPLSKCSNTGTPTQTHVLLSLRL